MTDSILSIYLRDTALAVRRRAPGHPAFGAAGKAVDDLSRAHITKLAPDKALDTTVIRFELLDAFGQPRIDGEQGCSGSLQLHLLAS